MPKIALPLAACCLLAAVATGASAQSFWKWKDAAGQIHLSDIAPPATVPAKDILQRPAGGVASTAPVAAPAAAPASGPPNAVDAELQKRKAKADKDKADQAAADKAVADQKRTAQRADNCRRAQQSVQAFDSGVRIAQMNAKGEREYLDDKQRAAERQHAQEGVTQNCGAAPNAAP